MRMWEHSFEFLLMLHWKSLRWHNKIPTFWLKSNSDAKELLIGFRHIWLEDNVDCYGQNLKIWEMWSFIRLEENWSILLLNFFLIVWAQERIFDFAFAINLNI